MNYKDANAFDLQNRQMGLHLPLMDLPMKPVESKYTSPFCIQEPLIRKVGVWTNTDYRHP